MVWQGKCLNSFLNRLPRTATSRWQQFSIKYRVNLCLESRVLISVKIGKNSARNQPKTLIPKHKNQIFQKFLTHFLKTSYEQRATRNGYIFVSNVQLRLIIEGVFFYSLRLPEFIRVYAREPPRWLTAGECVLTWLFCRGVCAYLLFCRGLLFSPPVKRSQILWAYPNNRGQLFMLSILPKLTNVADPPSYGGNYELWTNYNEMPSPTAYPA